MAGAGHPLADSVPIWFDARADVQKERVFKAINEESWYLKTGNGFPAALYSVFKLLWYRDNNPDLYHNTYKFIGTKDYINY